MTPTEKYLAILCRKTFLSLWSYPNAFRQPGSELCDLLVVVGNHIIIFSDKQCSFPSSPNLQLNWKRWFRRAVQSSAHQLWGAENWIRNHPERVFIDNKCQVQLPIPIAINDKTQFHLVLIANGACAVCREHLSGSGSLMFLTDIRGAEDHTIPFTIGDMDPSKSFIHVLDEYTMDILLKNRDTILDFAEYLTKREKFLRSNLNIFSSGEEEMLACYLKTLSAENEHDFALLQSDDIQDVVIQEGIWNSLNQNPRRISQIERDKISYYWDELIEKFSFHAITGSQYHTSKGGFLDSEMAIRFLALQTRFQRRILMKALHDMIKETPPNLTKTRVVPPINNGIYFVYLLFPSPQFVPDQPYESQRKARAVYLESTCLIVRLIFPEAQYVVGLAMNAATGNSPRSEDLMVFDCSSWCPELEEIAREDQKDLNILTHFSRVAFSDQEFPE